MIPQTPILPSVGAAPGCVRVGTTEPSRAPHPHFSSPHLIVLHDLCQFSSLASGGLEPRSACLSPGVDTQTGRGTEEASANACLVCA